MDGIRVFLCFCLSGTGRPVARGDDRFQGKAGGVRTWLVPVTPLFPSLVLPPWEVRGYRGEGGAGSQAASRRPHANSSDPGDITYLSPVSITTTVRTLAGRRWSLGRESQARSITWACTRLAWPATRHEYGT